MCDSKRVKERIRFRQLTIQELRNMMKGKSHVIKIVQSPLRILIRTLSFRVGDRDLTRDV